MQARVRTFQGVDVVPVDVQVLIALGQLAFAMVGLADKAVDESRERVRAALRALGLSLPPQRILVNLSPADLAKEGSHYDLPIALGLLAAMGVVAKESLAGFERAANEDRPGIVAAPSLLTLINHLRGQQLLPEPQALMADEAASYPDLAEIKGQETAKRVFEVAAAGGHNLLMIGPPGSGKSMLAARLPGLLPLLAADEALEATMVRSLAGETGDGKLSRRRSFRDPHHSATLQALVGGDARPCPGEVSLAHHRVLFLDELPEFNRATLEALRQPLESGRVTVARAQAHVTYPARFQLVAAMNPCRCGHLMEASRGCGRAPRCGVDYQGKLSGPLLDRIDLCIDVPRGPRPAAAGRTFRRRGSARRSGARRPARPPGQTRSRSQHERKDRRYRQRADRRPARRPGPRLVQAALQCRHRRRPAGGDRRARRRGPRPADPRRRAARAWHRTLRVARTLADLDGSDAVRRLHIAEALSYRRSEPRAALAA